MNIYEAHQKNSRRIQGEFGESRDPSNPIFLLSTGKLKPKPFIVQAAHSKNSGDIQRSSFSGIFIGSVWALLPLKARQSSSVDELGPREILRLRELDLVFALHFSCKPRIGHISEEAEGPRDKNGVGMRFFQVFVQGRLPWMESPHLFVARLIDLYPPSNINHLESILITSRITQRLRDISSLNRLRLPSDILPAGRHQKAMKHFTPRCNPSKNAIFWTKAGLQAGCSGRFVGDGRLRVDILNRSQFIACDSDGLVEEKEPEEGEWQEEDEEEKGKREGKEVAHEANDN
ncbi:hypothetical protein C8J56DRAFT_1056611 [Mycena floridula]|nr:hypothetical protein C8J56DRAFT_1056611 [Mycena floridula]